MSALSSLCRFCFINSRSEFLLLLCRTSGDNYFISANNIFKSNSLLLKVTLKGVRGRILIMELKYVKLCCWTLKTDSYFCSSFTQLLLVKTAKCSGPVKSCFTHWEEAGERKCFCCQEQLQQTHYFLWMILIYVDLHFRSLLVGGASTR